MYVPEILISFIEINGLKVEDKIFQGRPLQNKRSSFFMGVQIFSENTGPPGPIFGPGDYFWED